MRGPPQALSKSQMSPIPTLADEDAARLRIRRSRALATGLLLVMVAVFVGTWLAPNPDFVLSLLHAASEAGIVGGLADWFAVTALFRHPLGLPIPHTAILPTSKDRIGRALGAFVERSFLTEAVLLPRLRAAEPGRRLAEWLSAPANAALIAEPLVAAMPQIVKALENPELRDFLNQAVGDQLRSLKVAPMVGRVLAVLTRSGEADALFERAVDIARAWIEDNRGEIDRLVGERSRWWIPTAIDRRIANAIVEGLAEILERLHERDSDARKKLGEAVAKFIADLIRSRERRRELNEAWRRLVQRPEIRAWLNAAFAELARGLRADAAASAPRSRAVIEKAIVSIGLTLAADAPMRGKIDQSAERLAVWVISFRGAIARFMAEVVKSWDAETLAQRLELVIGGDLQYIRMNGTIVGALVGCALFLITRAARSEEHTSELQSPLNLVCRLLL